MTRLALAQTLVSGTVTLQGIPYSFTASASGTAMGSNVSESKKSATVASNSAAVTAARASIDKILADNSAILSDLEITSLISNNFTTTVRVFKPLGLEKIATTTDGINYTLKNKATIGSGQWLTVPSGKTLYGVPDNPLTNYGYLQLGDGTQTSSDCISVSVSITNNSEAMIPKGTCYELLSGYEFINADYRSLKNNGTLNNYGKITNSGDNSYVANNGTLNNYGLASINNTGQNAHVLNSGTFTNYANATINNSNAYAAITNKCGSTFVNNGTINNSGPNSSSSAATSGTGTCTATGRGSACNKSCT